MGISHLTARARKSAENDAKVLALIRYQPKTRTELQAQSGLTKTQITASIARLTAKPKRAHIHDYTLSSGKGKRPVPRYLAGDKPDAQKGEAAPVSKAWPKRAKDAAAERPRQSTVSSWDAHMERDPLVSALFGIQK